MPVRLPRFDFHDPTTLRKTKRKLWDGLTISLAIAVVLLGLAIFIVHPKHAPESKSAPTKTVSPAMASISVPTSAALV
jgi:hypothetical protein